MAEEDVSWDWVYKQNHESHAFWHIHWISKANDLFLSAKVLEPHVLQYWTECEKASQMPQPRFPSDNYTGTYFMLIAFCVENYLKALIVRENSLIFKESFRNDQSFFPKALQTHDLFKLANNQGFQYTHEEEDLLRRLSRCAIWAGRYPVPLKYTDGAGGTKFSDGNEYSVSWFGSTDVVRLCALVDKIKKLLG